VALVCSNSVMTDTTPHPPFEQLDYVYMPSRDVASDVGYFVETVGSRLIFTIEAMGTRVAMLELTSGPPRLLLTDHLAGDWPILVYRVGDLQTAMREMEAHGWQRHATIEIPQGPCCSFQAPGGQRLAIYELARPEVEQHFVGRRDF
jgi:hypothetical protein